MQIRVETVHDDLASDARERVEARVRFVMRRMRAQVMQVHVRLRDINGPRGGIDQSCQITLATDQHGTLVVHAIERQAMGALELALKRASGALVRAWQRQRRPVRGLSMARRPALAVEGAV
ncbi:MAG: HPF/RaiA family ribosome-associated protein [Hylemonella sp.]|nr:HPF/RaiA family ribosome-associated protein [Hylemonella sp.]